MLGEVEQVQALGILHLIISSINFFFIVQFLIFQLNFHGFLNSMRKQFVSITFWGNLGFFVQSITRGVGWLAFQYKIVPPSTIPASGITLIIIGYFTFSSSLAAHVALIFLRSKSVFETSPVFLKRMHFGVVTFYFTVFLTAVLATWDLLDHSEISFSLFRAFSFGSICSIAVIDVISTVSFVRYIKQIYSTVDKKSSLMSSQVHLKQNDLIAERSAFICIVATSGLTFYSAGAITAIFESSLISEPIVIVQEFLLMSVMILWMRLKIELDKVSIQGKESIPTFKSSIGLGWRRTEQSIIIH
jgi:hypothetical protein